MYVISGLLCGLAGVLWISRFESAQTNTAQGFELQTVAASVVGGVNIFGGSGSVLGVVLGAFLLGVINNALTLVQISPFWQLAAQGYSREHAAARLGVSRSALGCAPNRAREEPAREQLDAFS